MVNIKMNFRVRIIVKMNMFNYFLNQNTGVYRRSNELEVFIDISQVKELRAKFQTKNDLTIGGGVNLTETMNFLSDASKITGFEYCKHLVKHIDLIANVPVRNVNVFLYSF